MQVQIHTDTDADTDSDADTWTDTDADAGNEFGSEILGIIIMLYVFFVGILKHIR